MAALLGGISQKKCASGKQLKKMNRKKAPFIFPYPKYLNPYKKKRDVQCTSPKRVPTGDFCYVEKMASYKI